MKTKYVYKIESDKGLPKFKAMTGSDSYVLIYQSGNRNWDFIIFFEEKPLYHNAEAYPTKEECIEEFEKADAM